MTHLRSVHFAASVAAVGLMTAGCGSYSRPVASRNITGSAFQGKAFGGQQPIVGATIKLYAASTGGYGLAAMDILSGPLGTSPNAYATTGTGGSFTSTSDYTCPSYNTQVYLTATGGNPGLAPGSNNANIALVAALGPCGGLSASTYVTINELTTVASVWVLSPFMGGISAVGTSAANATGLVNAFATVNKLVNIASGTVSGPALPAGAIVPVAKINTLADILALCINSAGDTGTGTLCDLIFNAATVNGVKPADTVAAAVNLAQNPNLSTSLTDIVDTQPPFQPVLTSVPSDFSLTITYTGGGLSTPTGIAADASGNLWVPNAGNNTVSKLDALGVTGSDTSGFLSGTTGFTVGSLSTPSALALDQNGAAWITNAGNSTVTKVSSDGSYARVYRGGGLSSPSGVAMDGDGNSWVTNFGNSSVTKIITTGTLTNFSGAAIASPSAVAINPK